MKNQFSEDVQKLILELQYRNYSPRTVDSYRDTMQVLEKRLSKKLSSITLDEFKKYLQHLIVVQKCSTSYVNQHISAFKIFSQDILKRDWENIAIKRPRRTLKLPIVLSINEVEQLLSVSKNLKHRAMLTLMYSAGLRLQELIEIKPTDIDSQRMQVHISQGKGRKDRYSILSPKCLEILRVYFKIYRPKTYLFEPKGNPNTMMSSRTLQHIVKKNAKLAGIKKNITCHTLRHSFATHLLENGTNIKFIQQLLGHTSLRTTSVYLHLTNSDPASIKSPLEEMNI